MLFCSHITPILNNLYHRDRLKIVQIDDRIVYISKIVLRLVPGTWRQASATRYLVPGTRCIVPGTRSGARYPVHSTWYRVLVPGIVKEI